MNKMDILLADSDRDFLDAYKRLLTISGHNITKVFDGTQVITHLSATQYDMVILNKTLPRISVTELIRLCRQKNIPSVILSDKPINSNMLCGKYIGSAYLPFPFLPAELTDLIEQIEETKQSREVMRMDDVELNLPDFVLCGKYPITIGEINIFRSLLNKTPIDNKRAGPYITALNHKLTLLKKSLRIKYMINDGYRLVKINYE